MALAAVLVLLASGGCGIAETTAPEKIGEAAVPDAIDAPGNVRTPPGPERARSAAELVTLYFQAAVGGDKEAAERARAFLTDEARTDYRPRDELTVIRISDVRDSTEATGSVVTVSYRKIGRIDTGGIFRHAPSSPATMTFRVVNRETDSARLWITTPLPLLDTLMISDTALAEHYQLTPVYYFAAGSPQTLVPDFRWLHGTMPWQQRANWLVASLLRGPSPLSEAIVTNNFPTGSKLNETVVPGEDAIVVNLSSNVVSDNPEAQQRLADQLRWTLAPYAQGAPVELQIEGQPRNVVGSTHDLPTGGQPELFSLDKDRRVVVQPGAARPGVLGAEANAGVNHAAISPDYRRGVFVSAGKATVVTLTNQQKLTVHEANLPGNPRPEDIGRPTWIPGEDRFLIPVAGRLFAVGLDGRRERVTFPAAGEIRSVSLTPDGRRIAVAMGSGEAYVAALIVDENSVSVSSRAEQLAAGQLQAAAVAWSSPHHVLIGGKQGIEPRLYRVTADGAVMTDESPSPNEYPIVDVVALPDRTMEVQATLVTTANQVVLYVSPSGGAANRSELLGPFYASG